MNQNNSSVFYPIARSWRLASALSLLLLSGWCSWPYASYADSPIGEHPRLYFDQTELEELRSLRDQGSRADIWKNIVTWAEWCQEQEPRKEWIPTLEDDPRYENLYDRFYAAMHDMAIVEHLALTSALSDPADDRFFEPARQWAVAASRVWRNEADNSPDASKAYAVLRIMKALAVAYDVLYDRLSEDDRQEIRETILKVGRAYHEFFQLASTAGEGYNKHHGSVDAAPFGIMALALLNEEPEVDAWLEVAISKHVDYLLPNALTPSGTSDQSSNFWASTLQYRIFFLDSLRRVTGRDLFAEFPKSLPGDIALAAVAGGQPSDLRFNENNRSVLFGPSYGQINYWSPVLIYLARHHQRPVFQHLASWDQSLGSLQRTRYVTPYREEELMFCFGPYVYIWYDPNVPTAVDNNIPLSFEFPEPEVNEAYIRSSYQLDGIVVGLKKGGLVVHAGGYPVLVDQLGVEDINDPKAAADQTTIDEEGSHATIRCVGPESAGLGQQTIELQRPGRLSIDRETNRPMTWWFSGPAEQEDNSWVWPSGTRLELVSGTVTSTTPKGFVETKIHYGGMKFADLHPFVYPTVTVEPENGRIAVLVTNPD